MNKVFLIGRLAKDVELRRTQSNKAVASFTLAVDRRKKDAGADFIPCVAWEGTAEAASRYLAKGSKCAVSGWISTRTYEKNGERRYVTEITADEIEFLDPRNKEEYPIETGEDQTLPF